MNSRLVITGLLSLGVLLAGCEKAAPPSADQKSAVPETPEKRLADLTKRAERGEANLAGVAIGRVSHRRGIRLRRKENKESKGGTQN